MEDIYALLGWLEQTDLSVFIQQSSWAFPAIESVHVISLALVVGTITIIDLRLLGIASTGRAYTEMSREVLPWTWGAFVIAAITGVLMFLSQPIVYFDNFAFRMKILLIVLAGLNMIVFHLVTIHNVSKWDRESAIPIGARIAGTLSLAFWIGVIVFGRRVGFTMLPF